MKLLAEEMQAINKGLEKVEQELAASVNDGAISVGFRKVRNNSLLSIFQSCWMLSLFVLFIFSPLVKELIFYSLRTRNDTT